MRLLVLIPAFNVEKTIPGVVREVRRAAPEAGLLVVDDGSTDRTASAAGEEGARVLSHETNLGKGTALRSGFEVAIREGYEAVVTIDGDGQHPPEWIPRFVRRAEETDADLVVGSRRADHARMPQLRRLSNRLSTWLASRAAGGPLPDSQSGYRLVRTEVLRAVPLRTTHYETETELLIGAARRGFRIESIPIPAIYANETSHISVWRDTGRFLKLLAAVRRRDDWKS
ncbi:MAG: glycosyltransferase family 2 protein [Candidatus Eisenbacteria bacterium]